MRRVGRRNLILPGPVQARMRGLDFGARLFLEVPLKRATVCAWRRGSPV